MFEPFDSDAPETAMEQLPELSVQLPRVVPPTLRVTEPAGVFAGVIVSVTVAVTVVEPVAAMKEGLAETAVAVASGALPTTTPNEPVSMPPQVRV